MARAVAGETKAALAAQAGAAGQGAMLWEADGAGQFVFDSSDLSAMISADPYQAVFIPPSSAPSGASGAWRRQVDGAYNVRWFGATGDGVTDDSAAFVAAIAFLKEIAGNDGGTSFTKASPELFVPAGDYYMGTTTLDITYVIRIRGETSAFNGVAAASKLKWGANTTGIRLQAHNTSGAGTVDGVTHWGANGCHLSGLLIEGTYSGTEGEYHGIHAKCRFTADNIVINTFPGDGFYINCTSGGGAPTEGNANLFRIANSATLGNRNGIYTKGADANAGSIFNVDASFNREWGFNESSFLGNTYIACHSDANGRGGIPSTVSHGGNHYAVIWGQEAGASTNAPSGTTADNTWWYYKSAGGVDANHPAWLSGTTYRAGGAYHTDNVNGRNLFYGCYSEGGQGPSQFVYPTMVSGGLHEAGIKGTASYLRNYEGNLMVDGLVVGDPPKSALGAAGTIYGISATSRVGYSTGAGGTVTQAGGKTASVSINGPCGKITTDSTALAAGAKVSFLVNNSMVRSTDVMLLNLVDGFAAAASYQVWVDGVSATIFRITIENITAGPLSEALGIGFAIIGGSNT